MPNRSAIIIVNYNGLADTLQCLASLNEQTVKDFMTVVVDNASSEDLDRIARDYSGIVMIRRKENGGWAGGNNTGIEYALKAGAQNIILLNNDTIVAKNFVERIEKALSGYPDFGILGPLVNKMESPTEVMIEGCLYDRPGYNGFFQGQHVAVRISDIPAVTETEIVNGCCLAAKREVFDRIGLIDERFFLLCEESDLCLRAIEAGWKCGIIAEPLVWHKGAMSFKRSGGSPKSYYDPRNMWLLLKKHAGKTKAGRGWLGARLQYLRTVHYMYSIAVEEGSKEEAESIIDGVADAWANKFGPRDGSHGLITRGLVRTMLQFGVIATSLLKRK